MSIETIVNTLAPNDSIADVLAELFDAYAKKTGLCVTTVNVNWIDISSTAGHRAQADKVEISAYSRWPIKL